MSGPSGFAMNGSAAYPTVEDFEKRLFSADPLDKLVDEVILFPGLPYAFQGMPAVFDRFRAEIVGKLGVQESGIRVIGSGKLGYSLAPDSYPRAYSESSDIDVLMVDERLFDSVWCSLVRWHYARTAKGDMTGYERAWIGKRQKSIFWGWLQIEDLLLDRREVVFGTIHLKPITDLRVQWFNIFQILSGYRELKRRKVDGRLYRTWDHARMYHVDSLNELKSRRPPRRQ